MMIGTPVTKEDTIGGVKKQNAESENRLAQGFHQMMMEDFRFMEAARLQSGEYAGTQISTEDLRHLDKVKDIILTNQYGLVNFVSYYTKQVDGRAGPFDDRTNWFMTRMARWPPLDIWAHWVLRTKVFSMGMFAVIVLSSLLLCIEGEILPLGYTTAVTVIETMDFFFLLLFLAEIILKWADNFWAFWREYWNWFDFVVTVSAFLAPFLDLLFPEKEGERFDTLLATIKYFRLARILRSLNVVTRLHKIWIIWTAITRTFTALVFITFLILIFFYIFAIIGTQLFDRVTKTHMAHLRYVNRFSNMAYACLTLFQIFTIDHWYPILQDLVAVMGYPLPILYMMTWLLLGTIIFNNFFAGVMVNYFQNISQELLAETSSVKNNKKLGMQMNVFGNLDEIMVPHRVSDQMTDWETNVFHNIEVLRACGFRCSPSLWPRDTIFQYYIIVEALTSNLYERDQLFHLLNQALLRNYEG